jgi:hypothetical protein
MVANLSIPGIEITRYQWKYNEEDGNIRSVYNGRCLSIDHCNPNSMTPVVLNQCEIGDPQALCQGKNQQWIRNATNHTFASQMNGKWYVKNRFL